MIRHDDETKEKKRMSRLYAVEGIDSFFCECWIRKDWLSVCNICCDEHDAVVLNRMRLRHGGIVSKGIALVGLMCFFYAHAGRRPALVFKKSVPSFERSIKSLRDFLC